MDQTPFMLLIPVPTPILCFRMAMIQNLSPTPFMRLIPVPAQSHIITLPTTQILCLNPTQTPILSLTRPSTSSLTPTQVLTKSLRLHLCV